MAGEPLEEQLVLDITPALASIGELDSAFQSVIAGFSTGLTDAFAAVSSIASTPVDIPISADTSAAEASITGLDAPLTVPVEGDTAPAEGAITALDSTAVTVPVEGDVTSAESAIGALDNSPVTLEVDADTTAAQGAIDDLGSAATGAAGSSSSGGGGVAGLEGAVLGFKAATGAAVGETAGLTEGIGALGGAGTAAAVGGGLAFTGFLAETINLAADAEAQNKRFADTFGAVADQVKSINVGGLNISLEDLGKQSGTTNANLEATASRIGLLGQSSGASTPQIVKTTDNLLALGATISVNNPRLGDAADVTDRLTNAFARGGRALAPFGIALSSAQINAEALKETGKSTAAELTLFEKSTAGANLTLQVFGNTLGTKFASGADNAQVQLRALKTQIEETLVAVGTPLLGPAVESLQAFLPVAQAVGVALGQLAQAILPIIVGLTPALIPLAQVIGLAGDGIGVLANAVSGISAPKILAVAAGFELLSIALGQGSLAAVAFGLAMDTALGPVGIAIGALALLGAAFGFFHHDTPQATVDAGEFTKALLASNVAAQDLAGSIAPLSQAMNDQLSKLLETGKAGQQAALAAQSQGLSYADLTKTLLSSDDAWHTFITNQIEAIHGSGAAMEAQNNFVTVMQQARAELLANADASLRTAVASGTLTQAQIDAAAAALGVSESGSGLIGIYERLKPVIEAAAAAQAAKAATDAESSGALAQLRGELVAGTITTADATAKLTDLGLSAADSKTFIDGVTKAMKDFVDGAVKALPSVSGEVDTFQKDITTAFDKVQKDIHDKTGNVKADLLSVQAALDPANFIKALFADAATIAQFTANLRKLGEEGFTALEAVIAQKGPVAGGNLAATLASDKNKAAFATAGIAAMGAATDAEVAELQRRAPQVLAAGAVQGDALGTGVNTAAAAKLDLANITKREVLASGQAITVATPDVTSKAEALGGLTMERYRGQLDFVGATSADIGGVPGAIDAASGPVATAAGGVGTAATGGYGKGLDLSTATGKAIAQSQANWTNSSFIDDVVKVANQGGSTVGINFGLGVSQGISLEQAVVEAAAAGLAAAASHSANVRFKAHSPSEVGIEIGRNFGTGIAIGISDTSKVDVAAAGLADHISSRLQNATTAVTVPNLIVAGQGSSAANTGPQMLTLDLTIHQKDGTVVNVPEVTVPIPRTSPNRLRQRVAAEVSAG